MKILILSWRGPKHPDAGGAEQSTHEHARGWVKAGHKVTLFTSFFVGAKREEFIDGVRVIRYGNQVFGVHLKAFLWYVFKKHDQFDLVVDQFHGIPFFTPLYVRTKKLAFIHEVAKEVWFLNPWPKPFNLIPALIGRLFEPLIFKFFYQKIYFMTVSQSTKNDLVKWGITKNNIKIIHNGVTLKLPKRLPEKEKIKTLIFLGALTKDKGIKDALEAFNLINKNDPNWQFWIVGKNNSEYFSKLKNRINDLDIADRVRFWGFVSQSKKFELLARAHILINPSVREGWGLVNIEASAVGTPVIGYKVSGIVDSVINEKTGILVNKGDIKNLSQTAIFLLKNTTKYQKIQKEGLNWSKHYNWKKSVNESNRLILKLLTFRKK